VALVLDINPDSLRTSPDAWTVEVGLKPLLERSSFPSQETYKSFNEALTHAERATGDTRPTSLLNHPMQSHGAEMLRLACSFTTEAGIAVCAPVHDALLIEAADDDIDAVVTKARLLMGRASRITLGGVEVRTDVELVRYPGR